jgi:hypothetical protein
MLSRAHRTGPWKLKIITIENGTHAANLPEIYRQAMDWLFLREQP